MSEPISRDAQLADAERILRMARDLGFSKASFRITRGGTLEIDVEDVPGQAVTGHQWSTGRKR